MKNNNYDGSKILNNSQLACFGNRSHIALNNTQNIFSWYDNCCRISQNSLWTIFVNMIYSCFIFNLCRNEEYNH